MQPGKASVTLLHSAPTQYLFLVFQRGNVWTLEKQIAPLRANLEARALRLVERQAQAPTGWGLNSAVRNGLLLGHEKDGRTIQGKSTRFLAASL
jgi:hypothetical protein